MKTSAVPREAVDIYNNALALSVKGDYARALNEYKRAIEMYPGFIEAYNNMGEIYSQLGESSTAISTYKRALDIDRNYKVLLNLGVEYYNRNDYAASLAYFTESLSISPDYMEGNYYAGLAHFNLKEYAAAERSLARVVAADKRHLKANYLLSYIYYEWKDYRRTLACLDNIRDIADDRLFVNKYYGFCYYHLGQYGKAVEFLTVALESSPRYAKFRTYLKSLTVENKLREIGDLDAKIREMEEKMMKEPPSLREYSHLGMLYIFKGEYKKAESLLLSARH